MCTQKRRLAWERQRIRWPRGAGTSLAGALALLLLALVVARSRVPGRQVEVCTQQAPRDVPQPDFMIVERFGVSPEDVKLDRGLSAQALRGLQERALNDEERKVGAAVATVMEEETVRLLRAAGYPSLRGFVRAHGDTHDGLAPGAVSERR